MLCFSHSRATTSRFFSQRGVNEDGFKFNKEKELVPMLATSVEETLNGEVEVSREIGVYTRRKQD